MIKCICDICGKEFTHDNRCSTFKIKKRWHSWYESSWGTLDVHEECWKEMCQIIKDKKEDK